MWRGSRQSPLQAVVFGCAWLSTLLPCAAQLRAGASIAITAKLPSSVTLSDRLLPVTIVVANGTATVADIPLNMKWNINPREATGFRIRATLIGTEVDSSAFEVRSWNNQFRAFATNNSTILMNQVITPANRQGEQQGSLQVRVSETAISGLSDGVYSGWLKLEAQIL